MIYPIMTEFEWGIAGIIGIIIMIVGIRSIVGENRKPEPHDYAHDEAFQKEMDEESAKVEAYYNKVKADWEERYGRPWGE